MATGSTRRAGIAKCASTAPGVRARKGYRSALRETVRPEVMRQPVDPLVELPLAQSEVPRSAWTTAVLSRERRQRCGAETDRSELAAINGAIAICDWRSSRWPILERCQQDCECERPSSDGQWYRCSERMEDARRHPRKTTARPSPAATEYPSTPFSPPTPSPSTETGSPASPSPGSSFRQPERWSYGPGRSRPVRCCRRRLAARRSRRRPYRLQAGQNSSPTSSAGSPLPSSPSST